jgi:hypothetical protein
MGCEIGKPEAGGTALPDVQLLASAAQLEIIASLWSRVAFSTERRRDVNRVEARADSFRPSPFEHVGREGGSHGFGLPRDRGEVAGERLDAENLIGEGFLQDD